MRVIAGCVDHPWPLLHVTILDLSFTSKSCTVLEDDVEGSSPPVLGADVVELRGSLCGSFLGGAGRSTLTSLSLSTVL